MSIFILLYLCLVLVFFISSSSALNRISSNQFLKEGDTLVSAGRIFELGFFSPGTSKGRYLGIWYVASPGNVVWVANRETPLNDTSGVVKITGRGTLGLLDSTNSVLWSSNSSTTAKDAYAQLLDTGNLVVRSSNDGNPESLLWQSFDYPCDTFLPSMKIGKNLVSGVEIFLSSWKNAEDPSPGEYSLHLDTHGWPQLVLRKKSTVVLSAGSWNGRSLTGNPGKPNQVLYFNFTYNEREVFFECNLINPLVLTRYVLNPSGTMQRFTWVNKTQNWVTFSTAQTDQCQNYGWCGAYGSCNTNKSPICECLKGFIPMSPKDWGKGDSFEGCIRKNQLNCHNDGFLKYPGVKLPDTSSSLFNETLNLKECEKLCLRNCNCTAYANLYIEGSGCLLWFGNLIDINQFSQGGQDLFVRVAASDLDNVEKKGHSSKKKWAGIFVGCGTLVVGMIILGLIFYIRRNRREKVKIHNKGHRNRHTKEDMEFPTFDFKTIVTATNNFSGDNKLGEGGFGQVYKGTLMDGQDIAVKRLSQNSGQGLNELKNEIITIARLQHRNLVKLLGCCLDEEEKILVYEYLPNKSLDNFIFDQTKSKLLNWKKRVQIIGGIARGLLYLHQDSRMRIIHRDLKASNILLDDNMNPKISDFGLARMVVEDQTETKTNRVVGTYGYMPPEYAVHGQVSIKLDVFSFGVLVLEILSGKKNRNFSDPEEQLNLLGHAWRLWVEERPWQLIDGFSTDMHAPSEVLRCIHIGLLCVQQRPEDRPDMSSVVVMLSSDSKLAQPKQPAFYVERDLADGEFVVITHEPCSSNTVTISLLEAR